MENLQELQVEFARRQKRQLVALTPFLFLAVLFSAGQGGPDSILGVSRDAWSALYLILIVWYARFQWRHWRCPACDHPFRYLLVRECRKCGIWLVGRAPWP